MRTAGYIVVAMLAALLQATFLAAWRPLGIVPALALVAVLRAAVLGTATRALLAALAAGLVLDLAAGDRFGFNTTFLIVVVLAVAWLRRGGTVFGLSLELLALVMAVTLQTLLLAGLILSQATPGGILGRLAAGLAAALVLGMGLRWPLGAALRAGGEEGSFGPA